MDEFKEKAKVVLKRLRRGLPLLIVGVIIIVLLAGFTYQIDLDEGILKEDDWSNTPYAASTFVNGATINEDGTISFSTTAEELWDKMIENGSNIKQYLDSPEELARLMKAELVTQFPDTRSNPDEEIDWDSIINGDTMQGIIKFKRADTEGNRSTMTYVDQATFQSYIDEYNKTGSEEAKQNALSHFTLKKGASSSGGAINYNGPDLCWPTTSTTITSNFGLRTSPTAGASSNHQGIDIGVPEGSDVYACEDGTVKTATFDSSAGYYIEIDHGNGYVSRYLHNSSFNVSVGDQVKKGQVIAFSGNTGTSTGPHCHFEIRINGTAIDPLSFKYNNGMGNGTGGFGESDEEDEDNENETNSNTNTTNQTENNNTSNTSSANLGQTTAVNGDGYHSEYTSSSGKTYKEYKQYEGSYAYDPYWNGIIKNSGCGPTSIAILASGLTNLNYTPADIAREMDSKYGLTSYDTLKSEMDDLGMTAEVIQNPTAQQIQDNLRNGKVMVASVNANTIFANTNHIIALLDINDQGQIYVSNPGSSNRSSDYEGWYDVSELMKGCRYIVTTDSGGTGIAQSNNSSADYVAVVATWKQVDTTVTTDDPNVEPYSTTTYSMTTTDVNYEVMVEPYTMHFDFLWALLVIGGDKNFVFDIADLAYNSQIEITVHDNLTVNTDVDHWTYTERTKAEVGDATIVANCGGYTASGTVGAHTHDPWGEDKPYTTTKTVVTQTNTINIALTRANVWIVDYKNEFTYSEPTSTTTTGEIKLDDTEYEATGIGSTFDCEEIQAEKNRLASIVRQNYISAHSSENNTNVSAPGVTFDVNVSVQYFTKYINILDTTTDTVETTKYIPGTPEIKEKTDPDSEEPNFVTIFNDPDYAANSSSIRSASDWLFEILEKNDSTSDMVDLMKYLLYKATGADYGVTEFDFTVFYPGTLTSVGANDYIVHIDKSSQDIVIKDVETLKQAFSGYSGSSELIKYADDFLRLQEEYRVNAVFAAAVSISETSGGRAGHAIDGKNNWFNISCTCGNSSHGRFETYASVPESIERFYWQISQGGFYFTEGNYTVRTIGMIYCEDADAPGGWIDNTLTFMTQMFNAAGINVSPSGGATETGAAIVELAKSRLGCPYVWGAGGPDQFDCSGLTSWCYKQVGITIPHQSGEQRNTAKKVVPISEARPGDVLHRSGHVGIYIGNGQYIHAPQPGDVVSIANNVNSFECALQFY